MEEQQQMTEFERFHYANHGDAAEVSISDKSDGGQIGCGACSPRAQPRSGLRSLKDLPRNTPVLTLSERKPKRSPSQKKQKAEKAH